MNADFHPEEICHWVKQLQGGQEVGFNEVWQRFFSKLVGIVGNRVRDIPRVDPDDVVLSVFESVWRASREGRLAKIKNADAMLWWLLKTTHFKTVDHIRRLDRVNPVSIDEHVMSLISNEPNAEYCAILNEEFDRLMTVLGDAKLREITVMKIEGYSNREIEERMGIAPATVTRKLNIIRGVWPKET